MRNGRFDGKVALVTGASRGIGRGIPWGRPGTPEDIAGVVAVLSSADADYMT